MTLTRFSRWLPLVLIASLLLPTVVSAKEEIVAVVSSDLQPYQEALAGFQDQMQHPVRVIQLAQEGARVDGEPDVVVAFGGKAALFKYPEHSALVYGLAPGTRVSPARRSGPVTEIPMMPRPDVVIQKLKGIQPTLRRLAALWVTPASEAYLKDLRKAGEKLGVDVRLEKLAKPEELPDRLRALQGQADALWLPADPVLIRGENLVLAARYSSTTHTPLYSSIPGLTEKGAAATFSISYRAIGQTAARLVQKILGGSTPPLNVYVEDVEVTISRKTAEAVGLNLQSAQLVQR
jgi:hypothetical protein